MRRLITLFFIILYNPSYAEKILNVYIAANYLAEETIKKFEIEYKCRVVQNYFNENDEMLAKIAAGANGYDVIVPTAYATQQLIDMHKILPLNLAKTPNVKYLDKHFLDQAYDPKNKYSLPYAYDNVFLAYNKIELAKLGIVANTWAVIFEPQYLKKLKGRVTVFNSARNVFAAALLYLGKDPNTENIKDLEQARILIERASPYWAKFDSDTYYRSLARGNILVAMSYSVDVFKTQQDLKVTLQQSNIGAMLQKEGNMYELDNVVIPTSSKSPELAGQFINHVLNPVSNIELANATGASIINLLALDKLSPEIKQIDWVYPHTISQMHSFKAYTPKTRHLVNEMWLEIQFSADCGC